MSTITIAAIPMIYGKELTTKSICGPILSVGVKVVLFGVGLEVRVRPEASLLST
jgi:hypothetical protein